MSLESIFRETVARHAMLPAGTRVLAAVSGGADSTALLHLLAQLRSDLRIHVAHLDHGWRPDDAAADQAHVAAMARELDLPLTVGSVEPGRGPAGAGREARAREQRCRFLEETATAVGAARIATGHTRDDQAETVLLRLLRGAGARGLAGIPPVRLPYVRPLLDVSRRQIEGWLRSRDIPWRDDPSNQDLSLDRNRVRHRLLPALQQEMRGDVASRLASTAELLREDDRFLEELAGGRYDDLAIRNGSGIDLPVAPLLALPPALSRRVMRRAVQAACGDMLPPARETVARLERLAAGGEGRQDLPGGLRAEVVQGVLRLRGSPERAAATFQAESRVPGRLDWPEAGISLMLKEVDRTAADHDIKEARAEIAYLDLEQTGPLLALRNRQPGDSFYPLGLGGRKKLQDYLVDVHIPREDRDHVGLLTAGSRIVWVVGHRIDDRFRVSDTTRRVLRVSLEAG